MTDRYFVPSVARWFTQEAVLTSWVDVWSAASAATGHPFHVLSSMSVPDVVVTRARELEAQYGHDVAAAAEALRQALYESGQPEAAQWLHYGLCSSDVADTGLLLRARKVDRELRRLTTAAINSVVPLSTRAGLTPVVYRTHGQPAQVGPARARWGGVSYRLVEAARRPTPAWSTGFDGPTGTGGELTNDERWAITRALGVPATPRPRGLGTQATPRGGVVAWLTGLTELASVAEFFGTQVRLLAMTGEVREGRPSEYRGSSSMPHKHNPTRSERLCGLAPVVRGLVAGYTEAAASCWDAHSLEHSSAERVVIPQVCELVAFILTEVADIADTLELCEPVSARFVAEAPADSYKERNRLIAAGADGNEAYEAAREAGAVRIEWGENTGGVPEEVAAAIAALRDAFPNSDVYVRTAEREPLPTYGPMVPPEEASSQLAQVLREAREEFIRGLASDEPPATAAPTGVGEVSVGVTGDVTASDGRCECGHPRESHQAGLGRCERIDSACASGCQSYRRRTD